MTDTHDPFRYELYLNQWDALAKDILERDGRCTDPKVKNGGHHIKNNPLLIAAIEETRDCYFNLLEAKVDALLRRPPDEDAINAVDRDMADHYYMTRERLMADDYGFSANEKAAIRERYLESHKAVDEEQSTALSKDEVRSLTGSIIGRCVKSYEPLIPRTRGVDHFLVPSAMTHPQELTEPRELWSCRTQMQQDKPVDPRSH